MARSVIRRGLLYEKKRDYEKLGAAQRKRYERRGITREHYERGDSLQRARGHKRHEHVTRAERNPLSLTSAEYRFAGTQKRRAKKTTEEFARTFDIFKKLNHKQRRSLMNRVAGLHREYKRQHGKSGVVVGKGGAASMADQVRSVAGSGGADAGYAGGGAGSAVDDDYENEGDYEDEGEDDNYGQDFYGMDDYPHDEDYEDAIGALLFYH